MVYGKRTFNILTFKKEAPGLDGVISMEGTLLGMGGSLIISCIYIAFNGFSVFALLTILLTGTLGNMVDSLLGALLERRKLLNNDAVNCLNTVAAAAAALILYVLFR